MRVEPFVSNRPSVICVTSLFIPNDDCRVSLPDFPTDLQSFTRGVTSILLPRHSHTNWLRLLQKKGQHLGIPSLPQRLVVSCVLYLRETLQPTILFL